MHSLPHRLTIWVIVLALGGCHDLASLLSMGTDGGLELNAAQSTAPATSPSAATTGTTAGPTPRPVENLLDPRERRLKDVRQLTHGQVVASPRFMPDGKSILFLSRDDDQISLERISVQGGKASPVKLALPKGSLWSLLDGIGGPCAVLAPPTCSLEPWPDARGLVPCTGLSEIPTAEGVSCPSQPDNALPCVESTRGARACAMPTSHGSYVALQSKGTATPLELGPHDGLSFAPAFSPDGQRLLFVAESDGAMRLWVAPMAQPDLAAAVGPEASRTVDPVFLPSGNAVMFASTVDDTGGQQLDLDLLRLDSDAMERITFAPGDDRFPDFSPDGRLLAWVSERNADPNTSDLFIASWVSDPGDVVGR